MSGISQERPYKQDEAHARSGRKSSEGQKYFLHPIAKNANICIPVMSTRS